jgi:hypothetical protein
MRWAPLFHPRRYAGAGAPTRTLWFVRYLAGTAWRMSLTYRFNLIQGFRGFGIRLRQSWRLRLQFLAEALPMSRLFGLPFPRSRRLYAWLYRGYYAGWQRFAPVDALLAEFRPEVMVLAHLQTPVVTPYVLAAQALGVRMLGLNGSWDQPTTKGPLCPGVERVLVQNEQVRRELCRHHGISEERMATVGWPQMDPYAWPASRLGREEFLAKAGFDPRERYVVFAANPGRLSHKEPEIAAWLADRLRESGVRLHLRCHPNDTHWSERFAALRAQPGVRVEPPRSGDLEQLANLIRHAEVVVASAGSINLDAVALDTPTIGLAWEDTSVAYWDRQARVYELEHLAALTQGDGLPLAHDLAELESLVREALEDRSRRAAGRRELRRRFLEPLDGGASARIADEIAAMAVRA